MADLVGIPLTSLRSQLQIAEAAGSHLVLGLRRPGAPEPDPDRLRKHGFDLVGTLHANAEDGLVDLLVLREPSRLEGPR